MAMTKRARSKRLRKSEQLLGAGTDGQGYGVGVIGPDPRRTDLLLVLVFAVSIALSFIFFRVILCQWPIASAQGRPTELPSRGH